MSFATGETLVISGLPAVALPALQELPKQDPGVRYSRALPYVLHANVVQRPLSDDLAIAFDDLGRAAAVFHVYDLLHLERLPRRYTVEAGKSLVDTWHAADDAGRYNLRVLGPNGFVREFSGALLPSHARRVALPEVRIGYHPLTRCVELVAWNVGSTPIALRLESSVYRDHDAATLLVRPFSRPLQRLWSVRASGNWYDFTLHAELLPNWSRRFAGRLETGRDSTTDPALG